MLGRKCEKMPRYYWFEKKPTDDWILGRLLFFKGVIS
jgi:hypothetical protein